MRNEKYSDMVVGKFVILSICKKGLHLLQLKDMYICAPDQHALNNFFPTGECVKHFSSSYDFIFFLKKERPMFI